MTNQMIEEGRSYMLTIIAVVAIAAITPALLMVGPVIAGQLVVQLEMGPAAIGSLFMFELGAMSLATLPALYWLPRFNLNKASLVFGALFILANIASMLVDSADSLIITRVVSGLVGGSLTIICITAAGTFSKPDRVYGFWVLGQLVLGAIGLSVLPALFETYGLSVFFLSIAILMALCLPLMRYLPASVKKPSNDSGSKSNLSFVALMGLGGILLFYISLNGTWTFIGTLATGAGIDNQTSGNILAIATLFGIGGAAIATFLGGRVKYSSFLLLGYFIMIVCILMLLNHPDQVRFSIAAFGFKFAWTFTLPFILASLSKIDKNGQLMNLSNLVIGGGLAIGPMIAGQMIEIFGDFQPYLVAASILTFVSLIFIWLLQPKTK